MFWHFFGLGNCFGYFIIKLGNFSPNLLVALVAFFGYQARNREALTQDLLGRVVVLARERERDNAKELLQLKKPFFLLDLSFSRQTIEHRRGLVSVKSVQR
jgi:hypothetical protein